MTLEGNILKNIYIIGYSIQLPMISPLVIPILVYPNPNYYPIDANPINHH